MPGRNEEFGLHVARKLAGATDDEWPEIFEQLRNEYKLYPAIRQFNRLLSVPEHHAVAEAALDRVGLLYAD